MKSKEEVDAFLEHHGIPGMKWGVRHDPGHEGKRATTRKISRLDKKFDKHAETHMTAMAVCARLNANEGIAKINNKPEYRNLDFSKDSPLRRKYYMEHLTSLKKEFQRQVDYAGTNASGTKKFAIVPVGKNYYKIDVVDVKHATNNDVYIRFNVDAKGFVTSYEVVGNPLAHSDIVDAFLEHHGIPGMKWGHRKSPSIRSAIRTRRQLVKSGKLTKEQVRRGNIGFARNMTLGILAGGAAGLAISKLITNSVGDRFVKAVVDQALKHPMP